MPHSFSNIKTEKNKAADLKVCRMYFFITNNIGSVFWVSLLSSGGGGNWTRVRKHKTVGTTCLVYFLGNYEYSNRQDDS